MLLKVVVERNKFGSTQVKPANFTSDRQIRRTSVFVIIRLSLDLAGTGSLAYSTPQTLLTVQKKKQVIDELTLCLEKGD